MRGKQSEGLCFVVQMRGNATGQGQSVKGRGAAANFVHEHQRAGRCSMQNLGSLGHLEHEGRLRVGQIVGSADAGVNGVDRP